MANGLATVGSEPRYTTLLALVWEMGKEIESPGALAREAGQLVSSGRVVLTGNFRGCRLETEWECES